MNSKTRVREAFEARGELMQTAKESSEDRISASIISGGNRRWPKWMEVR